jgi:hypothetical protein
MVPPVINRFFVDICTVFDRSTAVLDSAAIVDVATAVAVIVRRFPADCCIKNSQNLSIPQPNRCR